MAAPDTVHAIRRADGEEVWRLALPAGAGQATSSVMLAPGGMLYVGTQRGVQAIGTGAKGLDPEARWPALRHDERNSGWAEP